MTTGVTFPTVDLAAITSNLTGVFTMLMPVAAIGAGIAIALRILKGVRKSV